MQDQNEFSRLLCGLYVTVLAAVLPLYTKGTYWQLGDTKYMFFRNITVFCLGVWILSIMVDKCRRLWEDRRQKAGLWKNRLQKDKPWKDRPQKDRPQKDKPWKNRLQKDTARMDKQQEAKRWKAEKNGRDELSAEEKQCCFGIKSSSMDCLMLLYGCLAALSAVFSSYSATAWMGYREWYMGAISQLLFVGIYFFASRSWQNDSWPIYVWEGAFFIVIALGLGQKLGWDFTGLLAGHAIWDWEYSHMISTVGNINWFCGYCSIAIAVPAAAYLQSRRKVETALLYPVVAAGLLLMCIQGSDAGVVMAGLCLGLGLFWGRRDSRICRRTLALAAGVFFGLPVYGKLALRIGNRAVYSLPSDGIRPGELIWKGWYAAAAVFLALGVLSGFLQRNARGGRDGGRARQAERIMAGAAWILMTAGLLALAVLYLSRQPFGAYWGNGRGTLWSLSWRGFLHSGWKGKLIGAGPDCFAEYIYGTFPPEEMLSLSGRWAGAIFANAHNEWLNQLVNMGVLGVGCYGGIFLWAAVRYRRDITGLMALALYAVNSLVSFQQVMNAPLFFLLLGICESRRRQKAREENQSYGKERPPGAECAVKGGRQVQI